MSDEERWLQAACRKVEERIIEGDHGSPPATLHVRRGGKLVASIACSNPRVLVLRLSRPAAAGFCATELVLVADAYGSPQAVNPEGQPWSVGEMQRRSREPEVAAILCQAVQVYRVPRGGQEALRLIGYRVGRGRVEWDTSRAGRPYGLFIRALREAVEADHFEPGTVVAGVQPAPNFTPAQVRLECDIATVRAVHELAGRQGRTVDVELAVPKDSWSQRRSRRAFARAGLTCRFL